MNEITTEELTKRLDQIPHNLEQIPTATDVDGDVIVASESSISVEDYIASTRQTRDACASSLPFVTTPVSSQHTFGAPVMPIFSLPPPPVQTHHTPGLIFQECVKRLDAVIPSTVKYKDKWVNNLSHAFEKHDIDLFTTSIRDLIYEARGSMQRSRSRSVRPRRTFEDFVAYLKHCAHGVTPIHSSWHRVIYTSLSDAQLDQLLTIPPRKEFLRLFRRPIPQKDIAPSVLAYINTNNSYRDKS